MIVYLFQKFVKILLQIVRKLYLHHMTIHLLFNLYILFLDFA